MNAFIDPPHFKMEGIRSAKSILTRNMFLSNKDLKDAYMLVPVWKYLRPGFGGLTYQFSSLPFKLCFSPFAFTEILKPVVSKLKREGILMVIYLDDILILHLSAEICLKNTRRTIQIFNNLGFIINEKKRSLIPS